MIPALPSINQPAEDVGVSRITAAKALRLLISEGYACGVWAWATVAAERE